MRVQEKTIDKELFISFYEKNFDPDYPDRSRKDILSSILGYLKYDGDYCAAEGFLNRLEDRISQK